MTGMPASVLIANRGEIARRIIGTARRLGVRTVAAHSEADAGLPFVREADEAVCIGGAAPAQSYLDIGALVAAAVEHGCDAVHPGYGFLSESAEFARAVAAAGLTWIGPSAEVIDLMGDKLRAKEAAAAAGVPAGSRGGRLRDEEAALSAAAEIGYPVMLKAAAGGGGIGMLRVDGPDAMPAAFATTSARAQSAFGSADLLLEPYVGNGRHVEVQILGLTDGRVVALGDRDCSTQRRHQKVVEEAPAPGLSPTMRKALHTAAIDLAASVAYRNAGTVEFLVDTERDTFLFLEMNTRLQVEHRVTEMVMGVDLVEQQLRIAGGLDAGFAAGEPPVQGHAIELRVYAEDPVRFFPGPGRVTEWRVPTGEGIVVDSGYDVGDEVTPYYDPLLAKLCVHGADRVDAIARARSAVEAFAIAGPKNNLLFLAEVLDSGAFRAAEHDITLVDRIVAAR